MAINEDDRTFIEEDSGKYTTILKDEDGNLILLAAISSATLTLYDKYSGEIINGRDRQNIINASNVTIGSTSGLLTWSIQSEDNIIVGLVDHLGKGKENDDVDWLEEHIALFQIEWDSGSQKKSNEVRLLVKNIGIIEQSSSSSSSFSSSSMSSSSSSSISTSSVSSSSSSSSS